MPKKSGKKGGGKGGGGGGGGGQAANKAAASPASEAAAPDAASVDSLPMGELNLQDSATNGHAHTNGHAATNGHAPAGGQVKSWTDGLPLAPPGEEPVYVYSPAGHKVTQYQLDRVGPVDIDVTNVPESDIPDALCCPISQEVLRDPVVAADGVTYERDTILDWLADNNTSPMTNEVLKSKTLIPNKLLRDVLELLYGSKENVPAA